MNKQSALSASKEVDSIQQSLTDYACGLHYEELPSEVIHATKVRVIDTLGVLIGGFFGESCQIARNIAAQMPNTNGATIIGTRMKTAPDLAAFVNGIASYHLAMTDSYHSPGRAGGHPSNLLIPVLTAAEYAQNSGRDLITSIVLGYEVYQRFSDVFNNRGFDNTNFTCISTAVAAGKLFGLSSNQLAHCISMAVVPNVILKQANMGHRTMFFSVRAGHAGRAGVFAALLARAGMEGPHLPFEGKAGWCDHVAGERFSLDTWGGNGTPFKLPETMIKTRLCVANVTPAALAAEQIAPLRNFKEVESVTVEVYDMSKDLNSDFDSPDSRETAFHSIPYVVAATLIDGKVAQRSYDQAHLSNPELRTLMKKIEIVKNKEFTQANNRHPPEHHTRVTVTTNSGERLVGKVGGDQNDLSSPKSDAQIAEKFRGLTEDFLGSKRVNVILDRLWHLEDLDSVATIPPEFVLC